MKNSSGFTLVELLVIIAIIGILSAIGITSFQVYRSSAAYASAETTLHNARNALAAGTSDPDNLPAGIPLTVVSTQGSLPPAVASVFPGLKVGKSIKIRAYYDPACVIAGCTNAFVQVNHCSALEYTSFSRNGLGVESLLQNVGGAGCP